MGRKTQLRFVEPGEVFHFGKTPGPGRFQQGILSDWEKRFVMYRDQDGHSPVIVPFTEPEAYTEVTVVDEVPDLRRKRSPSEWENHRDFAST